MLFQVGYSPPSELVTWLGLVRGIRTYLSRDNGTGNHPMERTEILERLRARIVRFAASKLVGDAAQDLAQEVMLVLHERYSAVDRIEELVPLSLEIARLKIWAVRRKSHRRGEDSAVSVDDLPLPGREEDPLERTLRRERVAKLEAALAGLGERCRELYRLKLLGHTYPEIQKKLGVSALNTLYTWDFRCRKQLLERLGERKES